jgi:hypothetical protein
VLTTPPRSLGGFPDKIRTVLRYVEQLTLTSTSGVAGQYNFSGNSVFDPNYTGTGGQPANYDDWTAHYNRYRAFASTMTIVFTPASATQANTMEMILYPTNSIDSLNSNGALAQPYALYAFTSPYAPVTLVSKMTTQKMVGNTTMADRLQAAYNADPSEEWVWNMTYQTADASTTASLYVKVIIDYDVEFFDRISGDIDFRMKRMKMMMMEREALKGKKRVRNSDLAKRNDPNQRESKSESNPNCGAKSDDDEPLDLSDDDMKAWTLGTLSDQGLSKLKLRIENAPPANLVAKSLDSKASRRAGDDSKTKKS